MAIRITNTFLKSAITAQIAAMRAGVFSEVTDGETPTITVTTVVDCPPAVCRELTGLGTRVIVLSAIPNAAEQAAYLEAGASAYLPMDADHEALRRAVLAAAVLC